MDGMTGPFDIVHLTQHWVLIRGVWYRDAWIRTDDGVQLYSIREDVL